MIMVYVTFVLYSIRKYFHGTLLFFYHISFKVPCCEKDWHSANNACSSQLNFNLRDEEMRFQRERWPSLTLSPKVHTRWRPSEVSIRCSISWNTKSDEIAWSPASATRAQQRGHEKSNGNGRSNKIVRYCVNFVPQKIFQFSLLMMKWSNSIYNTDLVLEFYEELLLGNVTRSIYG